MSCLHPNQFIRRERSMTSRAALAELLGTFTLVFIGAGAGALAESTGIGILGVGLALTGRLPWMKALWYWAAQFIGAALAAYLLRFLIGSVGSLGMTVPAGTVSAVQAIVVEAVLTFFLVTA